jgi:uncharacterized protein (DUF885 family)
MRSFAFTSWFLAAGLLVATAPVGFAQDADAALAAFFRQYLEEGFSQRPLDATRLGEHRFDHLLDDLSPAARRAWEEHTRRTLEKLPQAVASAKLSPAARIDYEILRHELTKSLWLAENVHPFEDDPRVYNEYLSDSVYLLLAQSTLPAEQNIRNAIARIKLLPQVCAAARASLKRPKRVATETAIRQNRGTIAFYEREILDFLGNSPQRDAVRAAAAPVIHCLREYQAFLEKELLPRADGDWRLGRDKFYRKLELELDAGLTADQVLAEAQSEFTRVLRDMYVIARQLWGRYYSDRPLPPDDETGRRQAIAEVLRAVGREHGPPEMLTSDARATVARITDFIRQRQILALPEPDRCQVIEMPEFQRGNSTAYLNAAPPLDTRAPSFYAVSPPPKDWDAQRVETLLQEYNRHMLQILTIHEAYPGHYVQLEYANRHPSLLRRVLGSGVYIEGWAVYTEQTMLDQGYGDGDLALRLTQLKFYLRAVANAILDHRLHCTAITDDEALEFLTRQAFQSEGEARLKIIRGKQTSCQLSTYFVGRMALYRLRQAVQREQGDAFRLDRFHEALLSQGAVPVKYLPALVRQALGVPK